MPFTFRFKNQAKSEQKIDFAMLKEFTAEKLEQIEYAKELDIKQIAERAMDDLTGASYVSNEEGYTLDDVNAVVNQMLEPVKDTMNEPAVDQKALDAFTGNPENGNGPSNEKDNPN